VNAKTDVLCPKVESEQTFFLGVLCYPWEMFTYLYQHNRKLRKIRKSLNDRTRWNFHGTI